MTDEAVFVRAILADPLAADLRLVYADWLEERGDRRAEFLRLESQIALLADGDAHRSALEHELRELRDGIDPKWLAWLDRARIENCDLRFEFQCPKRWENLQPTENPLVRGCDECRRDVFYCAGVGEARRHARHGDCVVIDSRVLRSAGDLPANSAEYMIAGGITAQPIQTNLEIGQRVSIREGALAGLQGDIEHLNLERYTATVALVLMGRRTSVELEWWLLQTAP